MKNLFRKINSGKHEKLFNEYASYSVLSDDEKDFIKLKSLKSLRCSIDVGLSCLAFTILVSALMICNCLIH